MIELLRLDLEYPKPERFVRARALLAVGGLVIVPTKIVYGMACDPSVTGALEKLVKAKGREGRLPFQAVEKIFRQGCTG